MKEYIKDPKIELSDEEIANVSDVEFKKLVIENQDGGVGRHTAPPRTTRNDTKWNGKEVRHQVDKKQTYTQTGRRDADGQTGRRGLAWPWRGRDWRSVGRTGQAV